MRPSKKSLTKKSTPSKLDKPLQQQKPSQLPIADLGDTDTSSSTDQELATDDQGFHSPPPATDGTDYELEFTNTGTRYLPDISKEQRPVIANEKADKEPEKNNDGIKPKKAANAKILAPSKSAAKPIANTNNAEPTATPAVSRRVAQKRMTQRDMNFLKSYEKLAARVDYMIPRAAFGRVVREIMSDLGTDIQYITAGALEALQTATEAYVQGRLEDANLLALHARRCTLTAKDMELLHFLRSNQR